MKLKQLFALTMFLLVGMLCLSGVNADDGYYNISSAVFVDSFDISGQEIEPEAISFNSNGTKMFILGNIGQDVNEYDCSTGFDVSTCSYNSAFSVAGQETAPRGMAFNSDGTKMFISGAVGDDVNEYHCTTGFDVSTCSYDSVFSFSAQETNPTGMAFSSNGTKMFIVGITGIDVNEYHCTTGFDVSTCSYDSVFSVVGQESSPSNIFFSSDGTKMFILGRTGQDVNEYDCSTGFDVSTCSYNSAFSVAGQETDPRAIAFNSDGTKMFITGRTGQDVNEYQLDIPLITPIIATDIQAYYNTSDISIQLNSTDNTNMSYVLNSGIETSICNDCNLTTLNLTGLTDGLYNITFISTDTNGQANTTESFTIDTTLPTINNNIPSEINSYTLTLNSSCTDANIDYCNITINNQTTALNSTNITLTENGNLSYTITAEDLAGNIITETGIVFVNPPFYIYFTLNNGTAITNFTINETLYENYFTGNIYDYGLGTHTFTFGKIGFVDTNFNLTFNITSDINTTYNITPSSIFISIYDRDTGNLITDSVSIVLVATYGYNATTTTGTFNISDIRFADESYQVIATSDDYESESVYFNFDNREIKAVSIYMLQTNLTNLGTHTIKAITDTGLLVNGAVCSALEWKPALSSFVTVAQGLTDSNGETLVNVELGTKLYKFKCTKGDLIADSNNKIVFVSGGTTTIQLAQTIVTPDNVFGDLTYSLTNTTLTATTQRLIYSFTDGNGLVDIGCLKIYKVIGTKRTLLQESCTSSSDAEIQLDQDINETYLIKAVASINIDGVVTELAYINFNPVDSIEDALEEYGLHIILPLIFLLLGMSLGFLVKPQNIYISLIGGIVMVWISVTIVPSVISVIMASFITLLCCIMLWAGYKYK